MDTIVSIIDIRKKFGNNHVLNGITVNIPKGSICGLVGPNGAGKTTLLGVITSLLKTDSGKININTRKVSALIEKPALFNELNATQNITQQLILHGLEEKHDPNEFLEYLGIENTHDKKVKDFSLGMKQKLALAMMLVGNPDLIILDEPMNGLDPRGMIDLRNLILKLNNEQGVTFLISSHLLHELEKIATHYIFINHGEIISKMTSNEFSKANKGHIRLEVDDADSFIKAMADLYLDYEKLDSDKMIIYSDFSITDLIIKLNSHGCIVRKCYNVENVLKNFS